ncbi:hypothetical protein [Mycolicibacter virginiensis]|uniref:hypothetical protein n=1 Tax=Mycolicibacter virginiensis TaxID=1795032 RepID=UPI0013FE158F|nr:hypothetical protein [Mycolicibacter virginiensis]
MIPAEHIERAKDDIAHGQPEAATAHALIAIAELLSANVVETYAAGVLAGGEATATAVGALLNGVGSGQ